jgi:hypothetical protein
LYIPILDKYFVLLFHGPSYHLIPISRWSSHYPHLGHLTMHIVVLNFYCRTKTLILVPNLTICKVMVLQANVFLKFLTYTWHDQLFFFLSHALPTIQLHSFHHLRSIILFIYILLLHIVWLFMFANNARYWGGHNGTHSKLTT